MMTRDLSKCGFEGGGGTSHAIVTSGDVEQLVGGRRLPPLVDLKALDLSSHTPCTHHCTTDPGF